MRLMPEWLRRFNAFIDRYAAYPLFNAISGALAIMSGALASFFSDDVKNASFYPRCEPSCSFDWKATAFWVSFILVVYLFFKNKRAESIEHRTAIANLKEETKELGTAVLEIRTLPNDGFLALLGAASDKTSKHLSRTTGRYIHTTMQNIAPSIVLQTKNDLDSAIREILHNLARLLKVYDLRGLDSAEYGAVIMVWKNISDVPPLTLQEVFNGNTWAGCQSSQCLVACHDLSTTLSSPTFSPDNRISDFALPPPKSGYAVGTLNMCLPGAPLAALQEANESYSSMEEFMLDLDTKCGLDALEKQQMESYFRQRESWIKSFVCIPLVFEMNGTKRFAGVLNIHSDVEGIFRDGRTNESSRFIFLTQGIITSLSQMLLFRERL